MAQVTFSELLVRLHTDSAFRQRFASSPAAVLREEGLDPDILSLPTRLDADAIEQQLTRIFRQHGESLTGDAATVSKLSADELWERFKVIGLNPEALALAGGPVGSDVAVAVVAYGTSMVTSGSGTQVVVATAGRGIAGLRSLEQLTQLRELMRRPSVELEFSVTGPDGVTVTGLTKDVVEAFLSRVK
jgi:hypothetical protein